jgi:hypothetical protein
VRPNEQGRCPREAQGKRVRVTLRNGMRPPESWPADGKGACRWTLTGDEFDILEWEIAG